MWGAMIVIERERSGMYFKALIGECTGQVGEAVHFYTWGGVDLQFPNRADPVTFAQGDVKATRPTGIVTLADGREAYYTEPYFRVFHPEWDGERGQSYQLCEELVGYRWEPFIAVRDTITWPA